MVDAAELITACSEYLLDFCLLTSAFCLLPSQERIPRYTSH
jgi:hypothetical protein